ncbi:MAG: tetratricopeptide repeat protein [Ignavibacteriaceae bacterium]
MSNRLTGLLDLHSKNPDDSFLNYGIALEYISLKDYSKAEEYLKNLLTLDPSYVPAYMQYAQLKEKLEQISEAKNLYRKGIEAAKKIGDKHAQKEMEEFLDELD